ncbi:amidase [Microbispora cellulosiformans]|uniref:Amidase n=1 Tax=Microbispora cellulosiformans TaxID=2614688 RepID=A0A5J5JQX7_9ACTN|nr:amidase family protein [Microbispora cellulosiformans]KAA9373304.1 amidase [Microbispora cellulosiformans]
MTSFPDLDATAIADLVTRREASAVEVVGAALDQLTEVDGCLRAFQEVWPERAMESAREVDRAVARGDRLRMAGVPIGVKAWQRGEAPQTRRLRHAGCVVLGLTSVPLPTRDWQTWGITDRGLTLNPWRLDRTPGGSSAGSGAAVASGVVPLATGSDGAGSLRIPAAWCGAIGLKPTNHTKALAVDGAIVRTSRDALLHASVLNGSELENGHGPVRAAWSSTLGFATVDPEQAGIARAAAERLRVARVIDWCDHPVVLADPEPAWRAASNGRRHPARQTNDDALAEVFRFADLLCTPTTPIAPHGHEGPGDAFAVALTWAFNLSGHPALSAPAGLAADGTPVGLQIVAAHGREGLLLRIARELEDVSGFGTVQPPRRP